MNLINKLQNAIFSPEKLSKMTIDFLRGYFGEGEREKFLRVCKEGPVILVYIYADGGRFVIGPQTVAEFAAGFAPPKLSSAVNGMLSKYLSAVLEAVTEYLSEPGRSVVIGSWEGSADVAMLVYAGDELEARYMLSEHIPRYIRAAAETGELQTAISAVTDGAAADPDAGET